MRSSPRPCRALLPNMVAQQGDMMYLDVRTKTQFKRLRVGLREHHVHDPQWEKKMIMMGDAVIGQSAARHAVAQQSTILLAKTNGSERANKPSESIQMSSLPNDS